MARGVRRTTVPTLTTQQKIVKQGVLAMMTSTDARGKLNVDPEMAGEFLNFVFEDNDTLYGELTEAFAQAKVESMPEAGGNV